MEQLTLSLGGFPCQPFSCAGKRGGKTDDRYLWPEMLRVIREIRPTWIIGENVPGIINLALDTVCADLENEGYAVQPFIIPACAVDAPHRRDRVWVVANSSAIKRRSSNPARCRDKRRAYPYGIQGRQKISGRSGSSREKRLVAYASKPGSKRRAIRIREV